MSQWQLTRQLQLTLKKALFFFFLLITVVYGQSSSTPDESIGGHHALWSAIIGHPADSRVYLGMWALHLSAEAIHDDNAVNDLVALTYDGYSAGAFKNSYYDWTYAAAIQREVYEKNLAHNSSIHVGYRAGGIVGYDDRLCGDLCSLSPVLPFVVPYINLQKNNVGFESQYGYTVLTAGLYYHF
ncbi:MAG: hypothetical protein CL816_06085 [Coxiellaceae bacterium]|nr:hypothetical protein [Coxiellaceae bacterium]|tara:strand:- start:668 stop:1219 length:552 start_codon:yes stop_codon:yes gene_type:complete